MKNIVWVFILSLISAEVSSQSCQQKLEDAKRAYFNGNISLVAGLLAGCLDKELSKDDRFDGYKLMVDAKLLSNEDAEAEIYMEKLLTLDPSYVPRETDIAEFKQLYSTYDIRAKCYLGLTLGIVQPDYVILYPQIYSGQFIKSTDYEEIVGYSFGLKGGYEIIKSLYADASLLFSKRSFKMQEDLMGFRRVSSFEREYTIDVPLQVRYFVDLNPIRPYLAAGYSMHYMMRARGDIDHWPLDTGLKAFYGFAYSAADFNLTPLRKRVTHAWMFSGGAQFTVSTFQIELNFSYERGFSNLTDDDDRYKNKLERIATSELLDTYSYVPDDYKLNSYLVSVSILKNISKPEKK